MPRGGRGRPESGSDEAAARLHIYEPLYKKYYLNAADY